jgi:hypothetical protein
MKIFLITLHEMIVNVAEVQVMAEDEPTARAIALSRGDVEWSESDRWAVVNHVERLLHSDEISCL